VGRVELSPEELELVARRAADLVLAELDVSAGSVSPFLSVEEAAEFLRCEPQRIYDLRTQGRLSKFGDGSRALVSRDELAAHAAGERVAHASPTAARSVNGSGVAR
jgi:excisionase family DNA binding protein